MLQLHGHESVERVVEIHQRFGLPVMKVLPVASREDVAAARAYEAHVDRLMFDAKPPEEATRPGGNALAFDWELLRGETWSVPWTLAGGLTAENVAEAVRISGTATVDVASGVEDAPGVKNTAKIRAFLDVAKGL
jgi:phosphoribosylanthranilate isomerase